MSNIFKRGFTLIEIVFVIVIIGIVSSIVVSYAKPNDQSAYDDRSFHQATGRYAKAPIQVMGHIRYAQHLAMADNKFDNLDSTWYKEYWQIFFENNADGELQYSIFSDKDKDNVVDSGEAAKDPATDGKSLTNNISDSVNNTKLNLYKSYGISSIAFSGGCNGVSQLAFDNFGRPYFGATNSATFNTNFDKQHILRTTCQIKLCDSDCSNEVSILVEPETGYVHFKESI